MGDKATHGVSTHLYTDVVALINLEANNLFRIQSQ